MIEGSLRTVPLTEVFQILATGQKSGILTILRGSSRARVYFELGRVQYAHLAPGLHLGEVMVRMDLLTSQEVQQILLRQDKENAGTPLGLMAVHLGLLDQSELRHALKMQVVEVITELLMWKQGQFSFAERNLDASQVPTEHTLDAMMLLMEVATRLEEFKKGAVNANIVFEKSGDPTGVKLSAGMWEVLGHVDGKRTALSIAVETDFPEREVYNLLYQLQHQQLITPTPYQIADPIVLILSPSSAMQRLMRLGLQRARLQVEISHTTEEAFGMIESLRPQAIVVEDEDGHGWEFVREVRRGNRHSHLPILVVAESDITQGILGRLRRPKANFLKKPFREIDFQQTVIHMLGRSL